MRTTFSASMARHERLPCQPASGPADHKAGPGARKVSAARDLLLLALFQRVPASIFQGPVHFHLRGQSHVACTPMLRRQSGATRLARVEKLDSISKKERYKHRPDLGSGRKPRKKHTVPNQVSRHALPTPPAPWGQVRSRPKRTKAVSRKEAGQDPKLRTTTVPP